MKLGCKLILGYRVPKAGERVVFVKIAMGGRIENFPVFQHGRTPKDVIRSALLTVRGRTVLVDTHGQDVYSKVSHQATDQLVPLASRPGLAGFRPDCGLTFFPPGLSPQLPGDGLTFEGEIRDPTHHSPGTAKSSGGERPRGRSIESRETKQPVSHINKMNSEISAPTSGPSVSQETESSAPPPPPSLQAQIDALNASHRAFVESIVKNIEKAIEQGQELKEINNRMSDKEWTDPIEKIPGIPSAYRFSVSEVRK